MLPSRRERAYGMRQVDQDAAVISESEAQGVVGVLPQRARELLAQLVAVCICRESLPPVSLASEEWSAAEPLVRAGLARVWSRDVQDSYDSDEGGHVLDTLTHTASLSPLGIGLVLAVLSGNAQDGWKWLARTPLDRRTFR